MTTLALHLKGIQVVFLNCWFCSASENGTRYDNVRLNGFKLGLKHMNCLSDMLRHFLLLPWLHSEDHPLEMKCFGFFCHTFYFFI